MLRKSFTKNTSSFILWIGAIIPIILYLYLISKFAITTIFWDEWEIVPLLESYYKNEDWFSLLLLPHNLHIAFFPYLIILGTSIATSFDTFAEIIVAWLFLVLALIFYWLLIKQTVPDSKWLIIPISWVLFSFSQYENILWGLSGVAWNFIVLLVIASIYFLNKVEHSSISFSVFVILCVTASFSMIAGISLWALGFFKIRKMSWFKNLIFLSAMVGTISLFFLLQGNGNLTFFEIGTKQYDLVKMLNYVLIFFGSGSKISADVNILVPFTTIVGSILLSVVTLVGVAYFRVKTNQVFKTNLNPWFHLIIFSILTAIITAIGRIDFGIQQALASRYTPASNLFLVGLIVAIIIMLNYMSKNEKSKFRLAAKPLLIIFLVGMILTISAHYISGYVGGGMFYDKIMSKSNCLLNYDSASNDCLQVLYPDVPLLKERARVLEELCLGPFYPKC